MESSPRESKKTIKDRIRDRFTSVKQKSSDSLFKSRSIDIPNRKQSGDYHNKQFNERLGLFLPENNQEIEIKKDLDDVNVSLGIKDASQKIRERRKIENDFFLLQQPILVDDVKDKNEKSKDDERISPLSEPNKIETPLDTVNGSKKTALDYFDAEMNEFYNLLTETIVTRRVHDSRCEKLFWDGTERKLEGLDEKRNPADEGISVGSKPPWKRRFNHLKAVLSHTDNASDWFDSDGNVIMGDVPIRESNNEMRFIKTRKAEILVKNVSPIFLYTNPRNYSPLKRANDTSLILEFDVGIIKFYHHPLFSIEHILSEKLNNYYEEYIIEEKGKSKQQNDDYLSSLRQTKLKIKQRLLEESDNDIKQVLKDESFRKCVKEISNVRKSRTKEGSKNKILEKSILSLWKNIKSIREKLEFTSSDVVLAINKMELNLEEKQQKWEEEFEKEVADEIDEIRCDHFERKVEYIDSKRKYRNQDSDDSIERPVKPILQFEEEQIRRQIYESMIKAFKQPEEPNISFILNHSSDIITQPAKSPNETNRRADVDKVKMFIKILINGKEVCRTKNAQLNPDFTLNINGRYSVQLLEKASTLKLILFEQNLLLPPVAVSELFVQIPKANVTILNAVKKRLPFKILINKDCTHYGVGTCESISEFVKKKHPRLSLKNIDGAEEILTTHGSLQLAIGWDPEVTKEKNNIADICIDGDNKVLRYLNKTDKPNIEVLSRLFETFLDPNNPENAFLFTFLNNFKNSVVMTSNFYMNGYLNFNFTKIIDTFELTKNVLDQTNREAQRELKKSPYDADNASTSSIGQELKRSGESVLDKISLLNNILDPMDLQRRSSIRYLQLVNDYLFFQSKASNTEKQLPDVVTVLNYPGIRRITVDFLQPKRPLLHQSPQASFTPKLHHNVTRDYSLRICILKAFQLPNRIIGTQSNNDTTNNEDGLKIISLKPFVRVSCQGKSQRTSTAMGNNPTWNEQLCFEIKCNKTSTVNINLFDEMYEDLLSDNRLENTIVHYQYSASWLASLKITLFSIMSQNRMEGTFLMYSPPEILGYKHSSDDKYSYVSYDSFRREINFKQRDGIFISMYLEIFPTFAQIPSVPSESFESNEMDFMIKYLKLFQENFKNQFPHRNLDLLVVDTSGKNVCITRFFKGLSLPEFSECLQSLFTNNTHVEESSSSRSSTPNRKRMGKNRSDRDDAGAKSLRSNVSSAGELRRSSRAAKDTFEMKSLDGNFADEFENNLSYRMQICVRFVALIPLFEFHSSDNQSVVLAAHQFLKLVCGSMLDHTILLMNYFLGLGVECWCAVGHALPRGRSAYVLVRENQLNNDIGLRPTVKSERRVQLKKKISWRYCIYEATSTMKYDIKDSFCPLKSVDFICNDENIWANIQAVERCDMTNFNLSSSSDWRPLFMKGHFVSCPGPLPTMTTNFATEDSQYTYCTQDVQRLRESVEDKIRAKFQKWRGHRRTIWNRHCCNILRGSLPQWEKWCISPASSKPKNNSQLQQLQLSYQIYGFPFNVPYTTLSDIVSTVKSTQLHLDEHTGVEFALAVDIYVYPNSVHSVWVYLASVLRK